MVSPASTIVYTYPEENPFNADPPYPNIFPQPPKFDDLAEADIENALQVGTATGCNPLARLYGQNPFDLHCGQPRPSSTLFIEKHTSPPPLPEISVTDLEFIEKLNPKGHTSLYKVLVTINATEPRKLCMLKMDPDEEIDTNEIGWPMYRFRREKEAYAHLIDAGLSERGIVPHCHGWFTISRPDIEKCYALPLPEGDPELWIRTRNAYWIANGGPNDYNRQHTLLDDRRPPKALLFDYHEDMTPEIAEAAVRALYEIHAAYVLHGDVNNRNIVLLPGNRGMWINFDESTCGSETLWRLKLTRQRMLDELAEAWGRFYQILLPDGKIGLNNPFF